MEQLDIFNEVFEPLYPASRSIDDVHKLGLWHQTFACWLVNKNSQSILFQLRGPRNRIDPGSYDASASGHLSSGEKPEDGFRELKEELGIHIEPADATYLGIFRNIAVRGTYINHEFCHVYMAEVVHPLEEIQLQDGEVSGIFEASIDGLISLLQGDTETLQLSGKLWNGSSYTTEKRSLKIEDLCNWKERTVTSNYYLKVALAARDYVLGKHPIVI